MLDLALSLQGSWQPLPLCPSSFFNYTIDIFSIDILSLLYHIILAKSSKHLKGKKSKHWLLFFK